MSAELVSTPASTTPAAVPHTTRIDLRLLAPERHTAEVLAALLTLPTSAPLLLALDQPMPTALRQALDAAAPAPLQWQLVSDGPTLWQWRVLLAKPAGRDCCGACS